jgi:hypothetical protein
MVKGRLPNELSGEREVMLTIYRYPCRSFK